MFLDQGKGNAVTIFIRLISHCCFGYLGYLHEGIVCKFLNVLYKDLNFHFYNLLFFFLSNFIFNFLIGDFEVSQIMVVLSHQIQKVIKIDVFQVKCPKAVPQCKTKHNLVGTAVSQPKVGNEGMQGSLL